MEDPRDAAEIVRLDRRIGTLAGRVGRLERTVAEMTKADEIAQAVAVAVRRDRRRQFTFWQKVAGAVAMILLALPSIETVAGWISG